MDEILNEEVLINAGIGETRIATVVDGRLDQLILERARSAEQGRSGHSLLGNIYLGRVQRVLPGMQAAFVEAMSDRNISGRRVVGLSGNGHAAPIRLRKSRAKAGF